MPNQAVPSAVFQKQTIIFDLHYNDVICLFWHLRGNSTHMVNVRTTSGYITCAPFQLLVREIHVYIRLVVIDGLNYQDPCCKELSAK